MSLSNPNKPVTEQRLQEFYHKIEPYMGGGGGTGGGGHTIEDSEGTALTQRDTLQFGDGLNASDDSENEKTVVEPNLMTAADMDDVVTPLPSVQSRYQKYSTEEQIVGEWIDGKPLYQIVLSGTTASTAGGAALIPIPNYNDIDTLVGLRSFVRIDNSKASIIEGNYYESSQYYINVWINSDSVKIMTSNAYTSKAVTFILQYTKTT